MKVVYIVSAVRTPVGKQKGFLRKYMAPELLGAVLDEAVRRIDLDPGMIDDVVAGTVYQVGERGFTLVRMGILAAQTIPETVPGISVNRQCGSGLSAIQIAHGMIASGTMDVVIAGGCEKMSQYTMMADINGVLHTQEPMGNPFGPYYVKKYGQPNQIVAAQKIADQWGITREECMDFTIKSHQKAQTATDKGYFKTEILPMQGVDKEGHEVTRDSDETNSSPDEFRDARVFENLPSRQLILRYFLFVLCSGLSLAWAGDVRVCQTEKIKYQYRIKLAELILAKTANQYGSSRIVAFSTKDPTQSRCIDLLMRQAVDLVYLPITKERLLQLDPIKIDIHNGMLGFRVLLIRKSDQAAFETVTTLDDLRNFKGGFGSQWGDFKLFALNRLPVVGVAQTHLLLNMLNNGRFDYYHRGLHEAWAEIKLHKREYPNLMVEKSLALKYDFPVYFMFNKKNKALKKRFQEGFDIILKDGSFKRLFLKNFDHILKQADFSKRNVLSITYPMPKGLPPIDTRFWLPHQNP